jgi:uncharacterized protein involved in tellurium resistance
VTKFINTYTPLILRNGNVDILSDLKSFGSYTDPYVIELQEDSRSDATSEGELKRKETPLQGYRSPIYDICT